MQSIFIQNVITCTTLHLKSTRLLSCKALPLHLLAVDPKFISQSSKSLSRGSVTVESWQPFIMLDLRSRDRCKWALNRLGMKDVEQWSPRMFYDRVTFSRHTLVNWGNAPGRSTSIWKLTDFWLRGAEVCWRDALLYIAFDTWITV